MLTVCIRNDLGRELAQSDRLLTHTFSTVVSYNEVMLICDFYYIFQFTFKLYIMYVLVCDTFCLTCCIFIYEFVDLPWIVVEKALRCFCCVMFHIYDVK